LLPVVQKKQPRAAFFVFKLWEFPSTIFPMPDIYCVSDRAIQIEQTHCALGSFAIDHTLQNMPLGPLLPRYQCIQADRSVTLLFENAPSPNLLSAVRDVLVSTLPQTNPPADLQALPTFSDARHHWVPVQYGGAAGPDLEWLAAQAGLGTQALIDLHCSVVYTVRFLGFLPGFAYLGGLPGPLQHPRRSHPRPHVPAGTLAVGAEYCAVYPWDSPGGWHLLGHVDLVLFDANRSDEAGQSLFQVGDSVQFVRAEHV